MNDDIKTPVHPPGNFIRNSILLFVLWFVLSGMTQPLLIGFGVFSSVLTAWVVSRLVYSRDDPLAAFRYVGLLKYLVWLTGQIITSSFRVMYIVLHPAMPITPGFARVQADQLTRLGHVAFANSITLTPGTASVDLGDTEVLVHSLERAGAQDLQRGEMGRRVRACEYRSSATGETYEPDEDNDTP